MRERKIVSLLGGAKLLGPVKSPIEMAQRVRQGFPAETATRLKQTAGLTDTELSGALGVSVKTVERMRKTPELKLSATASDRIYRFARMVTLATEVLEDRERALNWLRTPKIGLNNAVPLELLGTEAGAREIEDLLLRIEHGVYA
jgi:putative toxin-antitoxin system antitoxin component (TIGR02293 family)